MPTRFSSLLVRFSFLLGTAAYFAYWTLWRLDLPSLLPDEILVIQPFVAWRETGTLPLNLGRYHFIWESILTAPFILFLGKTEFALRIGPPIYSCATVFLFYFCTRELYGEGLWAAMATWILASSPTFLIATRAGLHHGIIAFPAILAGFLFLRKYKKTYRPVHLFAAAICAGVALGSRSWLYIFGAACAATFIAFSAPSSVRNYFRQPGQRWVLLGAVTFLSVCSGLPVTARGIWREMLKFLEDASKTFPGMQISNGLKEYLWSFRTHINQIHYQPSTVLESFAKPNHLFEILFWACLAVGFLLALIGRSHLKWKAFAAPSLILLLYIVLLFPIERITTAVIGGNHFLCAYLLCPLIVVGTVRWAHDLLKKRTHKILIQGVLIVLIVVTAVDNHAINLTYRKDLENSGGHWNCSTVVKEVISHAENTGIRTIIGVLPFDPRLTVPFYSQNRIRGILAESPLALARVGSSNTGVVIPLGTRNGQGPEAELNSTVLETALSLVAHEKRVFRNAQGRPIFTLRILAAKE